MDKMDKETKELLQQLGQKLDVVAALLLRLIPKNMENLTLKEQIKFLNGIGIRPMEISKIVGRSQSHVNKELVAIRKGK